MKIDETDIPKSKVMSIVSLYRLEQDTEDENLEEMANRVRVMIERKAEIKAQTLAPKNGDSNVLYDTVLFDDCAQRLGNAHQEVGEDTPLGQKMWETKILLNEVVEEALH